MNFDYLEKISAENLLLHARGASEDEIRMIENNLGIVFAKDYRTFLLKVGACMYNGHEIVGISEFPDKQVETVTLSARQLTKTVPFSFYVIEDAHMDGIMVWQDASGIIYQTSPGSQPVQICQSLEEYISR